MFRKIKKEIRIIGFDDSPFSFRDEKTFLIGVICRGGSQIDGVVTSEITVDGHDSTRKIAEIIKKSRHYRQLRIIMLDGITFAGFNVVDINTLHEKTGLPVIVVISEKPDLNNMRKAIRRFDDHEKRWSLIQNAGEIYEHEISNSVIGRKKIYFQSCGINEKEGKDILNITSIHSLIPEPVRIAHMIGYGLKGIK